jgi:SAM-dependent methyltransferase
LLRSYFSDFDVNGMLGIYPMHVLSTEQWRFLLEAAAVAPYDEPRGRLLDVGAGSGDVTVQLAPLFERVVTTELSRSMAYRLRRRGFSVHRTDVAVAGVPEGPYDVVSCLNVLDRCATPLSLLGSVRAGLGSGGLLVLALVLPYRPFVYEGPSSVDPMERLPLDGLPWEAAVNGLCAQVLEPLSLEVVAVSRVPYLSGGDSGRAIYELDDAIVVCRAVGNVALL